MNTLNAYSTRNYNLAETCKHTNIHDPASFVNVMSDEQLVYMYM